MTAIIRSALVVALGFHLLVIACHSLFGTVIQLPELYRRQLFDVTDVLIMTQYTLTPFERW